MLPVDAKDRIGADPHVAAEVLLMILITGSGEIPITPKRFEAALTAWGCLAGEAGIPGEVVDGWLREHLPFRFEGEE